MYSRKFSKNVLASSVAALCLPAMSLGFVSTAKAEISASATIASMYLWRGLDVSGGAVLQSSLQYDHSSGLYVGTWMSTEGAAANYEVDAYAGYGGSAGDISYGIGVAGYYYPQAATGSFSDNDIYEVILSGGYKDYGITAYINAEPEDFDDYMYFSIDGPIYGPFSAHIGITSQTDADYTDVGISYAATENLTWTVSKAQGDAVDDTPADNPIVAVSWSIPLK